MQKYSSVPFFILAMLLIDGRTTPVVQTVTGSVADGGVVTITGAGFGAQGPNVILFDDFEGGIIGQNIPLNSPKIGAWTSIGAGDRNPKYHAQAHSGSEGMSIIDRSLIINGNVSDAPQTQFRLIFPAPVQEIFLSYWVRIPEGTAFPGITTPAVFNTSSSSIKWAWIFYGPYGFGGDSTSDWCLPATPGDPLFTVFGNHTASSRWNGEAMWWLSPALPGTAEWWSWTSWIRMSFWLKGDPSGDGTGPNGTMVFQSLAAQPISGPSLTTQSTTHRIIEPGLTYKTWDRMTIPGWMGNGNYINCDPVYDDIYLAGGPGANARVEIGDASSYTSCHNLALSGISHAIIS